MSPAAHLLDLQATPAAALHPTLLVLALCAGLFVIVGGLMTCTMARFTRKADRRGAGQVFRGGRKEIAWMAIPFLIVLVLVMATTRAVNAVQRRQASANALHVTVTAHQFWWEVRYPDLGVVTANELHIPVNTRHAPRETVLQLESAGVGHGFPIPSLGAKTDVVPDRQGKLWLDPRKEGTYFGRCREDCGQPHANMQIRVVVQSAEEFGNWIQAQRQPAASNPQLQAEREAFLAIACAGCHRVSGTAAAGSLGPDLSHMMSRQTLAGGAVTNSVENLKAFIQDPQRIKPGSRMPRVPLSDKEMAQVVVYLSSLK